mmetsp:Transcript_30194/g.83321  ORF Transcript_30194/g.83321 Transcript_30194/m.83321 type:complete len:137 (-) Transcript_30194:263-673(-)|eukprot:CAMPEP_0179143320 /NCGR_PEP_ID=MMETSP0796-20121207/68937_1 /TAXON_ID=73915 /ORGANISM="Pyrodinium bahamense, Strain pbaha01" /LENGTH=136 /DNA_ID=CAMNT_0020843363 /DNA_START=12 /DNA_END=422 /DNA_ORIENTATION=+
MLDILPTDCLQSQGHTSRHAADEDGTVRSEVEPAPEEVADEQPISLRGSFTLAPLLRAPQDQLGYSITGMCKTLDQQIRLVAACVLEAQGRLAPPVPRRKPSRGSSQRIDGGPLRRIRRCDDLEGLLSKKGGKRLQ